MVDLQAENASLKRRLAQIEESQRPSASNQAPNSGVVSIVVLGASGDLARKKTFPSLFALFNHNLLPAKWHVCGFARTAMTDDAFRAFLTKNAINKVITAVQTLLLKGAADKIAAFVAKCHYRHGQYDSGQAFAELNKSLIELENKYGEGEPIANRMFYYAIPPSVFVPVSQALRYNAMASSGWTRIVVEKPFGRDLESSNQLGNALGRLFSEDQIYRIDHYLGKELVQNLMVLRFANSVFEPLWNSHHISNVQITFKEDIGTDGRGGYFDEFGIIRDVMQNHLTQILALVAMEPPVSLDAEDVRDEKVKLLRAIPPIELSDCVIGQYVADKAGKQKGYLEDPTVPKGSVTPTFAAALLHINNTRWKGTPFVLKCGKALNERKAEVRIQFRQPLNGLFDTAPNELVLRVQPGEAVYMKMTSKKPGLNNDNVQVELDLSYQDRFQVGALPDAYERLILEVLRGDHNLFVRGDELAASWRIFTPLLHKLEKEKIKPETYEFGSRGPITGDELVKRSGFIRTEGYNWKPVANTGGRL